MDSRGQQRETEPYLSIFFWISIQPDHTLISDHMDSGHKREKNLDLWLSNSMVASSNSANTGFFKLSWSSTNIALPTAQVPNPSTPSPNLDLRFCSSPVFPVHLQQRLRTTPIIEIRQNLLLLPVKAELREDISFLRPHVLKITRSNQMKG